MKRIFPLFFMLCLIAICFNDAQAQKNNLAEIEKGQSEKSDFIQTKNIKETTMSQKIITFLTFQKEDAEQAMNLYIDLFDNSEIVSIERWGKDMPGKEGTIMQATFSLSGRLYRCSDSPPVHAWDFTPAVSNFVECENEGELERLFTKLSEKGEVTMPLGNYGFSQKFGWVIDQFGVSWQLNLQ